MSLCSCFNSTKLIEELEEDDDKIDGGDKEIDSLIINAIFNLRVHLIELSKVFDLCADFKLKYMQSLKKTVNQETMIGLSGDSDEDSACTSGPIVLSNPNLLSNFNARNDTLAMLTTVNGMVTIPLAFFNPPTIHSSPSCSSAIRSSSSVDRSNVFLPQQTQSSAAKASNESEKRSSKCPENVSSPQTQLNSDDEDHNELKRKLPLKAVELLKDWYYNHLVHPYPNDTEKCKLSKETGLHITQINNWFINARRRIVAKTSPSSTADSEDAAEWSSPPKKRKTKPKSTLSSYTIESFFADDQKSL
uniref:Homeobox domain-containing protein n=1 Tax=Syphacia muris TaxID=451379 RepID=A0A0N5AWD0_9BILA